MLPILSILILNYRNATQTLKCVSACQRQSLADRSEIIVIDNASGEAEQQRLSRELKASARTRFIALPKNIGFGAGYNRGAAEAQGMYYLINNPDKILQEDGHERLVSYLKTTPDCGIVAPALYHQDGSRRLSARAFPSPLDALAKRTWLRYVLRGRVNRYLQQSADPQTTRPVDWVAGGCFCISQTLFTALHGFDERFFLFFEDIDLCRRCRLAGRDVVYHPAVTGQDKKERLSDGRALTILLSPVGRSHLMSAVRYYGKWMLQKTPTVLP